LTFQPEMVDDFIQIFEGSKDRIRGFEGCEHLKLFREKSEGTVFFTYSIWQSEEALNNYRHSELFQTTWAATKVLFADKPEAWTVDQLAELG